MGGASLHLVHHVLLVRDLAGDVRVGASVVGPCHVFPRSGQSHHSDAVHLGFDRLGELLSVLLAVDGVSVFGVLAGLFLHEDLGEEEKVHHTDADGDGDHGGWERGLEEHEQRDLSEGVGGDVSVLRIAEERRGAPNVGRSADAKQEGDEFALGALLLDVLRQDERRHEKGRGIVGDEGSEARRQQHHLPQDGFERLVLAEYPEGHDA